MWVNEHKVTVICVLLLGILCSKSIQGSKLNLPRALLPLFYDFSTNFTLEVVEGGCFKWKTSRLDVIQLIPLDVNPDVGCSGKAMLSTISKESTRNTVIVFAEEVSTGQVLRCDVIVDVISSLNIVTTTRELFMEEAPELFEVRAYDDQGNEFTTLEGVEFHWTIGSWNDHSLGSRGSSVLRFITFRDSPYETPPTIAKFDAIGLRGHIVLLEGIKTGSAKVSVQLPHTEYRHVPPIEVQLIVVANLLIDPPDAYIILGDTIKYKLLQVQHGKLEEIQLPSNQYYLEVEDPSIAIMYKTSSSVRGLKLGRTKVILRDRNVDASESGAVRVPTASLTVATPAYLTLSLLPHRNWAVLVNQLCTVVIEMFDSDNHKMCIGESTNLVTTVPDDLFELRGMTRNGSHLTGIAIKPGTATIKSVLESVRGSGGDLIKIDPTISAQADLEIYSRLSIKPSEVILPWYPHIASSKHEAKLKASGGDGLYLWSSANQSIAFVTQSGIVKAQNQGQTEVIVAMQRNQHNRETAKVHVLPPDHMEVVEYILEAEVGTPIYINIAMYAYKQVFGNLKRIPFTRCQDLPFKVKVWESNFYYNATAVSSPIGIACATVAVIGKTVGSTKVTLLYSQGDIELEASTVVAAYQPLKVVQPPNSETVLAVGSSRHIVWTGGPRPWLGRNFQHSHVLNSDLGIVEVQELFNNHEGMYVYNVLCRALGEADVTLTVENKPAALANCKSAVSTSTVKVFCAKPRYISLMTRPIGSSCPTNMNTDRVIAHIQRPLKLILIIKDDRGRIFDNGTSYDMDWLLSKKSLASISHNGVVLLEESIEENYVIPLDHYQILMPNNETGILKISAALTGYKLSMLRTYSIIPESPPFGIIDESGHQITPLIDTSIMIVFVNDTIITPNRTTIFNHPTNKIILKVSEGSGHYNVILNSPEVAAVNFIDSSRTLEVTPRIDGSLKIALVDLCLPSKPAIAEVQVLRVGSIKVDVIDRIEKGHYVTAYVRLFDSLDNPLSILDIELLELRPSVESDIILLKPIPSDGKREIKFTVTGKQLGETKLIFTSGRGLNEVQSSPVSIQVFPPLRLIPRNLTLTIGAAFQLKAVGGPQPDATMEYFSSDQLVAKVSAIGLIETSRMGDIHVTGMAVGLNKVTGNKIIYCKDTVEVHVIPLEGIKIQTPLFKLKIGSKIPVWAGGIPDHLSPLVLGTIQPPMLFKWHVSSPDIIELRDVFFSTGIEVPDKDRLSMRVKALKPGRATLHLNATVKGAVVKCPDKFSVTLSDFIEIEVFEELRLLKPNLGPEAFKPLLLAPDTEFQLQTNKDGGEKITYSVLGYPYLGSNSGTNSGGSSKITALTKQGVVLNVDGHGLISTGSASGRALVLLRSDKDYSIDQTIGINVEVKPVYYLMMNVNAKLRIDPDKQITALPRGLDLEIFITYHDNTGSEFASTRTDIRLHTNRFDKVHITRGNVNSSLFASLVGSGSTVLKVWDDLIPFHSQDYVKFSVDHLMFPDKTQLIVGDLICFSMPLLSEDNESGKWSSADPDILKIERPEGVAHATGKTGLALITYHLSNAITATTAMQVLPITSIIFLPLDGQSLSNTLGQHFEASLLLLNDQISDKTRNMIAKDNKCYTTNFTVTSFPFSCEVRFNSLMTSMNVHDVFIVRPYFSIETGLYSCRFEASGPPSADTSELQSNISLRAVSGKVMSDPLVIPFLPALFIHTPEIHLSDKQPSAFLTVSGTPQVLAQIQLLTKDSVLSLDSKERTSQTSISFAVKLKHRFWTSMGTKPQHELNINLLSPLTSQDILIPVVIHMRGDRWSSAPCLGVQNDYLIGSDFDYSFFSYDSIMVFVSIGVICMALYYTYFTILHPPRNNEGSSIYASTSPSTAPVTRLFQGNSPIVNSFNSPENTSFITRQPFSDMEPVYGDPNLSHHSPEAKRRARRLQ